MPHFFNRGAVRSSKPFFYDVTVPSTLLGVSLADAKAFANITGTADDALITSFIKAATLCFETATGITLLNTTYKTFRDIFPSLFCPDESIELRRGRVSSITLIQYLKDNALTTVPAADYYFTKSEYFSQLLPVPDKNWPEDGDSTIHSVRLQSIEITFVSGFGATDTSVPEDIRIALLHHITKMNENRGDCDDCTGSAGQSFANTYAPKLTRNVYNKYRPLELGVDER